MVLKSSFATQNRANSRPPFVHMQPVMFVSTLALSFLYILCRRRRQQLIFNMLQCALTRTLSHTHAYITNDLRFTGINVNCVHTQPNVKIYFKHQSWLCACACVCGSLLTLYFVQCKICYRFSLSFAALLLSFYQIDICIHRSVYVRYTCKFIYIYIVCVRASVFCC